MREQETGKEQIRADRRNGALLGPLVDRYGAEAVVLALGVSHVACALGVSMSEPDDAESPDE
jgi:hypothetical protein